MCGSDGLTYSSECYLKQVSCRDSTAPIESLHEGRCKEHESLQITLPADNSWQDYGLCEGCPEGGSPEYEAVVSAAQFVQLELTKEHNQKHYLALDSIRKVKINVRIPISL